MEKRAHLRFPNLIWERHGVSQCHRGFGVETGVNPSELAAKTLASCIGKPDIRQQW